MQYPGYVHAKGTFDCMVKIAQTTKQYGKGFSSVLRALYRVSLDLLLVNVCVCVAKERLAVQITEWYGKGFLLPFHRIRVSRVSL